MRRVTTRRFANLVCALVAPLVIAGCGSSNVLNADPSNGTFTISPGAATVDTNGQLQFKATLNSGGTAAVTWQVTGGGDPNAGAGTINSATGVYVPPGYLTEVAARVQVAATLNRDPGIHATAIVTVTPGFLQPLTPENATLSAGSSVQVTAQIAQVGGGSVDWSVSTSAAGSGAKGAGSISKASCQANASIYTTCVATYTAPNAVASSTAAYVVAKVHGFSTTSPLHVLLNDAGIDSTPLTNQAAQSGAIELGSSGGNDNDYDVATDPYSGIQYIADCCGGTLGGLLNGSDGKQYVLSNNHVLAESDQARVGDTIIQPGLIDTGCTPIEQSGGESAVGTLASYIPLASSKTNVDAAIARVNAGAVSADGSILQLGQPGAGANGSLGSAPPASTPETVTPDNVSGLAVVKSGRTTGLTCSAIDGLDAVVIVPYFTDCAETNPYYTKTFSGQLLISGNNFTDAGDSGSLVMDASNAAPVGLFYASATDAGGNGLSVANPIGDVLSALNAQNGVSYSIAGGAKHPVSCLNYDQNTEASAPAAALAASQVDRAKLASRTQGEALVNPAAGVLGVAEGRSEDNPREGAVLIYTDRTRPDVAIPQTLNGVRTVVIPTDLNTLTSGKSPTHGRRTAGIDLPSAAIRDAMAVKARYARLLTSDPAIFGVAVTQSHDNPAEAALLVLVDRRKTPRSTPAVLGGLRVRYAFMERFHVTRTKNQVAAHPSSCSLKAAASYQPRATSR
jgi:hypothetical protein